MRLFIMGESRFGAAFFRAAQAAGHELVAAAATANTQMWRHDPLVAVAKAAGVPIYESEPILGGWFDPVRRSGAELLVLANVSRLLPEALLNCCPKGTLCFHPSLLPQFRGKRAVADAIKSGQGYTGVSIFWPDAGADTGPVLLQARCEIAPNDTPGTLYHDKLLPVGIYCLLAAVAAV